ncbi:hypothetical protein PybrP1_007882 [[Pythium] brassicae (nom. inval.)]|nr:hypothetical protein PybrP1_007882 [[Pythium] brassicae (nom. inval.)]
MINLAFILDITGSMENELRGVKETVRALVKSVSEDETHRVMVTIITFTEDSTGCYVTNNSFESGKSASSFVSRIQLCVPPESVGVSANGGDGDENHKAALAELLRLDGAMPTIAFLISDAGPHLVADRPTKETTLEVDFLKRTHSIVNTDMFHILALVQAHFGANLILNVIKYTKNSDHRLYGAIARQFGGVLITPIERHAAKLAAGLMAILTQMFKSFSGASATGSAGCSLDEAALRAFEFYDMRGFVQPASETEVSNNPLPVVGSTKVALFGLIERATVIVGSKFAKRAIAAAALQEQVELLLVIAKCLTKTLAYNTALDRATALVAKIREVEVPNENQGHFKIQASDLPRLLSQELAPAAETEAAVSAITLMGPEETAKTSLGGEGDDEEKAAFDPVMLIQTVGSLFLGHLAVLQLPTKNGEVDFMDSWSAVINKVSNDVMTASDFLAMIGSQSATAGLSIRANEYNYAQMFADPSDPVGSALLQVASGTQVLDILTGLLAGAPAGQFSPNMFRGTISATLMALLSQHEPPLSEFQWGIVRKLVHSIQLLMGPKPAKLEADPESPMPKLLFRLLRLERAADGVSYGAARRFLQEMLATRIQKVLKYNPDRFFALVERVVGYDTHVSMVENVTEPHALDADVWWFDVHQAAKRAATSKLCAVFRICAENTLQVLFSEFGKVPTLDEVWPTFVADLPRYLLLHKRTARYMVKADLKGSVGTNQPPVWVDAKVYHPLKNVFFAELAMKLLHKKHDAFLRDLRARRADIEAEYRWHDAVHTMKAPMDEFVQKLSAYGTSACREHRLLLRAFKIVGVNVLDAAEYAAKLQVVITGRVVVGKSETVVFNRGNLHPHPDRFVPMSNGFKAKLRSLQQKFGWSLTHTYRPSDIPNHSGFSNSSPSEWARRRSLAERTFWEV